jgi:hypothetical protein
MSKSVTFNLESSLKIKNRNKNLILNENKLKRRNSINSISQIISTKLSIKNRSFFSSELKILKGDDNNMRIDAYGNEIKKGEKNYKISFIDQISSNKIAEIILIDNNNIICNNKDYCKCNSCFIF